jgi:hypothetical protein
LNLKNKTSFPPLNYVTTLKRDKKGYTTEEEKQYGTAYNAAAAHFSAAVASLTHQAGARRARLFFLH